VRGLSRGGARLAAGLTPKGKVLYFGWLVGGSDRFLLVVPRDAAARVLAHLAKYAAFQKVTVRDASEDYVAASLYAPLDDVAPPDGALRLPGWGELAGRILAPARELGALEAALAAAGSTALADEDAEARRIEAGRPRLGADATDAHLPDEVGLEPAISRTKGCYVGQEVVARRKTYGKPTRRLVGLRFERELLLPGTALSDPVRPDRELGRVTSAAVSPRLGPIGLGIASFEAPDGARLIAVDGAGSAALVPLPFA
jgi:folate-binding protein YgfZ